MATSRALPAEFLSYASDDGALLNAMLFAPGKPGRDAVVYVPGMTGGFVAVPYDYMPLARRLTEAGYALFIASMRTAGLHGMLFARFADYEKDIAAVMREAKAHGYDRIILLGTSLGGPRIIHYWTRTKDPAVQGLVFHASIKSPYLEAQIRFDAAKRADFDAFLAQCRDLVRQGRGEDILIYRQWFTGRDMTMAARTFVDIFGTLEESDASTVKFGAQVTVPAVVIHGTKDEQALPPNGTAIYESLTSAPSRELIWVEGAGHFLTPGKIAEDYASAIAGWVSKVFPAAR
jgi:alpha-beta hydrolase superfamily lysophospholipase